MRPSGATATDLATQFGLATVPTWTPRYNIAPNQGIPAVIQNRETGARELWPFHWRLVLS